MKHKQDQAGFHLVAILLAVVVVGVISVVGWRVFGDKKTTTDIATTQDSSKPATTPIDPNQPPVKLKTIGVNLDTYNSTTNHAGDFVFTKANILLSLILSPYGQVIPGNSANDYKDKTNPQPEFRVPMGTNVHSLIDGYVTNVPKLYSDDYSVMVSPVKDEMNWQYETEHVINVLVKPGDHVTAGQVIAQVSPHNKVSYDGLGLVELGILHGGNSPQHVCPFAYLDDSIKADIQKKLLAFFKSWEDYRANTNLYDEAKMKVPGCITLDPING